jgi:hypothetical protein
MLTDDELKEIRARHRHEWDDGFEDVPFLIEEIAWKNAEVVLLYRSLRAHAEKIESLNAVIETLTDKLTAAGIIVDVKQAEVERLNAALDEIGQLTVYNVVSEKARLENALDEIIACSTYQDITLQQHIARMKAIACAARKVRP